MKKMILILLLGLIGFSPAEAQLMYTKKLNSSSLPGFSQNDDQMVPGGKKRRKSTRGGRSGKKRGGPGGNIDAGLGPMLGITMGDFSKVAKTGFGVNLMADYFVNPQFSVGILTGYQYYKLDPNVLGDGSSTVIPLKAVARYYFSDESFKPYGGLALGVCIVGYKYDSVNASINGSGVLTTTGTTKFDIARTKPAVSPMLGFQYGFGQMLALDVNAQYNMVFTKETSTKDGHLIFLPETDYVSVNFGILFKF